MPSDEGHNVALKVYDILKPALYTAIQSAPNILFVVSAGNEGVDMTRQEKIPTSFTLPNLLTVSMVDQAGQFANGSYGKVDVYAFGAGREVLMPDGRLIKWSGTSLAAPEVVNLAGKLLALCPKLTVPQLIELILKGSDEMTIGPDKKARLLNPKKSLTLLQQQCVYH